MAIYLDDELLDIQATDLQTVLDKATSIAQAHGLLIVDVQVDGQRVQLDEINTADGIIISDAQVKLTTADPRSLAVLVLQEVNQQLDAARIAQNQAAELFQQDQSGEAMGKVGIAMDAWMQVQTAIVQVSQLLKIDLDKHTVKDQPATTIITQLAEKLRELTGMLNGQDALGAADALQYEWPQTVDCWQALIGSLIELVQSDQ